MGRSKGRIWVLAIDIRKTMPNILWKWSESESHSVVFDSLGPHRLSIPWNSPGQNTGVGSHSLLQWIFPIQGSNPGLPLCRQILYQLNHKGSPRILEWVDYPFSRGSSKPRHWVSCIAGRFFTRWAMREEYVVPCPISPTQGTCIWAALGVGDGQGSLACCSPWGHNELDMTEWLN